MESTIIHYTGLYGLESYKLFRMIYAFLLKHDSYISDSIAEIVMMPTNEIAIIGVASDNTSYHNNIYKKHDNTKVILARLAKAIYSNILWEETRMTEFVWDINNTAICKSIARSVTVNNLSWHTTFLSTSLYDKYVRADLYIRPREVIDVRINELVFICQFLSGEELDYSNQTVVELYNKFANKIADPIIVNFSEEKVNMICRLIDKYISLETLVVRRMNNQTYNISPNNKHKLTYNDRQKLRDRLSREATRLAKTLEI